MRQTCTTEAMSSKSLYPAEEPVSRAALAELLTCELRRRRGELGSAGFG
jgi:hypothetical protein